MKLTRSLFRLVRLASVCALTQGALVPVATAQSAPTATQQFQISAFVAGTGTYTNLEGGKNLDITAGADLTLLSFRLIKPAFEIRGSYPIDSGHISSQKSFLLGPKVEYPIGRLHPYADFFIGRGAIGYLNGGLPAYLYGQYVDVLSSNTFIYSPGAGLDYRLTHHLAAKADVQFEHWNTPVTPGGSIHPIALTLGGVYVFDFNSGHRHRFR